MPKHVFHKQNQKNLFYLICFACINEKSFDLSMSNMVVSFKKQEVLSLRENVGSFCFGGSMLLIFLFFWMFFLVWIVIILCLMSDVWCLMSDVWCVWCLMSDVWCLMSDVHIVPCVSGLSSFYVWCPYCSLCFWIVHSWLVLRFSLWFIFQYIITSVSN